MGHSHNFGLVVTAIVLAVASAYVSLAVAGRIASSRALAGRRWRSGGAAVAGTGIWSALFVGTQSLQLPFELGFDPLLMSGSLLLACLGAAAALEAGRVREAMRLRLPTASAIAGAAICASDYLGLTASHLEPPVAFDPALSVVCLLASLAAAAGIVTCAMVLRPTLVGGVARAAGALLIGLLLAGAHFAAIEAAVFAPSSQCSAVICLSTEGSFVGLGTASVVMLVLALTLLATLLDGRLAALTAKMLSLADAATSELRREVAESERMRESLRISEQKYRAMLETTADTVVLLDPDASVRYANQAVFTVLGYRPEDVLGNKLTMLLPERLRPMHRQAFDRYVEAAAAKPQMHGVETLALHRTGREIPVEISFGSASLNGQRVYTGFIRDVSEHHAREHQAARAARLHALMSRINGQILHTRSRPELLDRVCRLAVEQGEFRLAMVGLLRGDEIRPAAVHGVNGGSIEGSVPIRLERSSAEGGGPTASALRELRPRLCNDIAADDEPAPWLEAAVRMGHRSAAIFPLVMGGQLSGCLSLYAAEPDFFREQDVALLTELAHNISYAMEFIARDEKLDYLAFYDPLTGLANRRLFGERLGEFVRSARQHGNRLAVLMLDVDHFKSVNDSFGAAAADNLLRAMATRLVRVAGNAQFVARLGVDVFGVVLTDLKHAADLPAVLEERILESMSRSFKLGEQELRVSAKFGVALFPDDGDDADGLIRNAEAALKQAKLSGERFLFYSQEISKALNERLNLASQLRGALERDEFTLYYQPKVDLRLGTVCGAEALIRWNSPELGQVPPGRFVPLLEETGLVLDVGRWALGRAVSDHQRWHGEGLQAPRLAVNLSALQLRRPDFVDVVRAVVDERGGAASGIDLEITESVLMTDVEQHIHKLKAVRDMGLSISIDDFGTGYSSLAYLAKLPINAVKIDRSFIVGMTESADTMNIVSTIISLAHSMNLKVIAEGVESSEQLRFLRLLHCDEIQGYLFSKGLPPAEFAQLLRDGRRLPAA